MIKLQKKKKNNIYLYQTSVDNMFINDLLPMAPGDYVKVYMFGLMYAENGIEIKQSKLAAILRVPEDEIDKAWRYWEKQGVIEISEIDDEEGKNNYGVKFISLTLFIFSIYFFVAIIFISIISGISFLPAIFILIIIIYTGIKESFNLAYVCREWD